MQARRDDSTALERELVWLQHAIDLRLRMHLQEEPTRDLVDAAPPPDDVDGGAYARAIADFALSPDERLVVALALAPHVRPSLLDPLLIRNRVLDRRFTEFGGFELEGHCGLLPTMQTALFVLAGDDVAARLRARAVFDTDGRLARRRVLELATSPGLDLQRPLRLSPQAVAALTTGRDYEPAFGPEFPAQRIQTRHAWDDLVLDDSTRHEIDDIVTWARNDRLLLDDWGLRRRLPPGYRVLFFGPPGTGKTLAAALLAYDAQAVVHGEAAPRSMTDLLGDGSDPSRDHALPDGGLLTQILLPAPVRGERAVYFRAISRSRSEWPLVEAVVRLVVEDTTIREAAVAIGAVAPVPLRLPEVEAALRGKTAESATYRAAAALASKGAKPLPMTGYKVGLCEATVLETLERAHHAAPVVVDAPAPVPEPASDEPPPEASP